MRVLTNIPVVLIAVAMIFATGCQNREQSEEHPTATGTPSKDPKSTYGKIMNQARTVQTPSAQEQEARNQADELLRDEILAK